jgi:hypothetical protein
VESDNFPQDRTMKTFLCIAIALYALPCQAPAQTVTYTKEISRLVQSKCQGCHRAGDIAPFALATYDDVRSRQFAIRAAVSEGRMPPWKPSQGVHPFIDNYGLTGAEREQLLGWIAAGAPEGDPAELPPPAANTSEWQIGNPDMVLEMSKPFTVTSGADTYRCFVLPFKFTQPRWLSAVQVVPGNRAVVHHAVLFLDTTGQALARDGKDGKPGYDCFGDAGEGADEVVGAWVPGARISRLPEEIGIPLPDDGAIVMQVHYHFHGGGDHSHSASAHAKHTAAAPTDQTKLGFYFTKQAPKQEMIYVDIQTDEIEIPAGNRTYSTQAELEIPVAGLELLAVAPHMHLLGRQIKVDKVLPGGDSESMIRIDDWDFDYQGFYTYEKKIPLEEGSVLRVTCAYDNSSENPRNPNTPPKVVYFGEQTTDEMCLAFAGIVLPEGISIRDSQPAASRISGITSILNGKSQRFH